MSAIPRTYRVQKRLCDKCNIEKRESTFIEGGKTYRICTKCRNAEHKQQEVAEVQRKLHDLNIHNDILFSKDQKVQELEEQLRLVGIVLSQSQKRTADLKMINSGLETEAAHLRAQIERQNAELQDQKTEISRLSEALRTPKVTKSSTQFSRRETPIATPEPLNLTIHDETPTSSVREPMTPVDDTKTTKQETYTICPNCKIRRPARMYSSYSDKCNLCLNDSPVKITDFRNRKHPPVKPDPRIDLGH